MPDEPDGLPQLAERLNTLFTHVPRRDSSELYSNDSAAEELRGAGISVTPGYLRQLRAGTRRNPTARLLGAIAQLFDVPIGFFFDTDTATDITVQLENLSRLRTAGVRSVMARSGGLTARDLGELGPILDELRQLGGEATRTDVTGSDDDAGQDPGR